MGHIESFAKHGNVYSHLQMAKAFLYFFKKAILAYNSEDEYHEACYCVVYQRCLAWVHLDHQINFQMIIRCMYLWLLVG